VSMCQQQTFEPPRKGLNVKPCQLGKQTGGTQTISDSICPAPLNMLRVDVLEMPILLWQPFKHLLGVADDHSHVACVCGLKTKVLQLTIFALQFSDLKDIENVRSRLCGLTWVRDFLGGTLQGWLRERKIKHQTTARYSSQSNGRAERFLRTLRDCFRVMLSESALGSQYWCFAAYRCVRLYHRLPHSVLECMLWEACFGTTPDVSDL
jgi:hypothetical protein